MSKNQCPGLSAHGKCQAPPRYSVSRDIGQSEDMRVCGRHLAWFLDQLDQLGHASGDGGPFVVAHLRKGPKP